MTHLQSLIMSNIWPHGMWAPMQWRFLVYIYLILRVSLMDSIANFKTQDFWCIAVRVRGFLVVFYI